MNTENNQIKPIKIPKCYKCGGNEEKGEKDHDGQWWFCPKCKIRAVSDY